MNPLSVESYHTVLFCRMWDDCIFFYRDILGFEAVDMRPGFVEFEVASGSRIGLLKKDAEKSGKDDARFILSFRVRNIEEAHRNLSARCGEITAIRQHPWGARLFEMRDPEKRRLEFWTPQ